jgi:hypothetical protein
MEERFLELAKNKDITDEELFEEVCYVYEKSKHHDSKRIFFERFKNIRKSNPYLTNKDSLLRLDHQIPQVYRHQSDSSTYFIEDYEMKKRIQSLEQTLATFMEQTKVERLSQEAVMQSLSNELDEFQEEFYECQSEVKEQKERIDLLEDALKETLVERIPFVKDKTD